mmetsp:Transcript_18969/g.18112  ORF Transcript_18969/g.18112 Transcript_18969/m.18112 type:complete len:268 (-) Transcript_18969:359-1162(-)
MTQVYRQIYLVRLRNFTLTSFVFHKDCNEFIADLRCVLCIVLLAELIVFHFVLQGRITFNLNFLTLHLLCPPNFVQTFSEQYHICENGSVEDLIDFLRNLVEIEGEDLINKHFCSILFLQLVIVPLPFQLSSDHWSWVLVFLIFPLMLIASSLVIFALSALRRRGSCGHFGRKLGKMLVQGIVLIRLIVLVSFEERLKHVVEFTEGICWPSLPFSHIEVIFTLWVSSLVGILSRPSPASTAGGRVPQFPVRSFRVLLLDMSVESGVA